MNILFFIENEPHPNVGGIERVTYILANVFKRQYAYGLYTCYLNAIQGAPNIYTQTMCWDRLATSFKQFLRINKIDIIVSQRQLRQEKIIRECIEEVNKNIIFISVLHCMPGYEITDLNYIKYNIFHEKGWERWKNGIKFLGYPFYRYILRRRACEAMQMAYTNSDVFIVLSTFVHDLYFKTYQISPDSKLLAINNPLTYEYFYPVEDLSKKEKMVLIVNRLEERSKRISKAIRIWGQIEKKCMDWKLVIIGEGPDDAHYKELVKSLKLNHVEFLGRCEPFEYYKRASLFLMTSANEGWSMTLTEAMQTGNVPIALDSFPALHDIIDTGENGYIIPSGDWKMFSTVLYELTQDSEKRYDLARNAIRKVSKFAQENIAEQWKNLFETLKLRHENKG